MEGPEIEFSEAVIDNGRFGTRVVRSRPVAGRGPQSTGSAHVVR